MHLDSLPYKWLKTCEKSSSLILCLFYIILDAFSFLIKYDFKNVTVYFYFKIS